MQLDDTDVSCCQMVFMLLGSSRNINDVTYSPVHVREGGKALGLFVTTYTPWGCAFTTALVLSSTSHLFSSVIFFSNLQGRQMQFTHAKATDSHAQLAGPMRDLALSLLG